MRCQFLLSLFIPCILLGDGQFVSGGRIPSRDPDYIKRRSPNSDSMRVAVPGLQNLSQYVCSPNYANTKRQSTTLPSITVPRSQLRDVLLQIRILEMQFVALIDTMLLEDGFGPSNSSVNSSNIAITLSPTATIPLVSLSSAVDAALAGRSTKNGNASTTTTHTTTTFTPWVTVTATPSANTTQNVDADSTTTILVTTTTSTSVDAFSTTAIDSTLAAPSTQTQASGEGAVFIQTATGSSPTPETTGTSGTSYVFNAQSSKNVAVYFGQTPVTGQTTLAAQCADPNIDIVILAFVISATDGGQYPQVNFGAACGGQTPEMIQQAPGLLSCPELASNIDTCQTTYGKKVLLSIGGATSQISFSTATQASSFADVLWNLFGPVGNIDLALRPFGEISIDGFDVDNENNMPANYDILASTLRTHYSSDTSKKYYLSSAPQCPFPDASNPSGLLLLCDFVFVQFYNNPQCEIGSTGFTASVNTWSTALEASTMAVKPRFYVGAPAFSEAGRSAYANIGTATGMKSIASSVESLGLGNFGGVMLWDGPEGMLNEEGGKDIIAWAKEGLMP